ncbi:MAG TPA: Crp/Fnr family transcriptional regulator [Chloroflexota bacterium]|nr:Crp/Fnr family transcriptional regulator [Chloroflexota bacterium]
MQSPSSPPRPAPFAVLRRARKGGLLVRGDDPAESVYLVHQGQVRIFLIAETGEETSFALLGPGQVFGIAALLGYPTYRVYAEALTAAEVWALPVDRLIRSMAHDAPLRALILAALARRLVLAEALLRDVALLPVAERIPNVLARLQVCLGGERPRLTRERLAGLLGARRETVSRTIAKTQGTSHRSLPLAS